MISVKFSVSGVLYPYCCTNGGMKFGTEEWTFCPLVPCQVSPPLVQCVTPVGRKTLKWPSE